jgi:hypothetical protein
MYPEGMEMPTGRTRWGIVRTVHLTFYPLFPPFQFKRCPFVRIGVCPAWWVPEMHGRICKLYCILLKSELILNIWIFFIN